MYSCSTSPSASKSDGRTDLDRITLMYEGIVSLGSPSSISVLTGMPGLVRFQRTSIR